MRRHCALLCVCLLGPLLTGCGSERRPTAPNTQPECDGLAWLVGTWRTAGEGTQNVERWVPDEEDVLRGESVTRSQGEVVYTESLRIVRGSGGLEYRASPQDQAPNVFPLESCGSTWARFADPSHDWPQSIHYARTNDTLTATVAGTTDGNERTQTWSWTLEQVAPALFEDD